MGAEGAEAAGSLDDFLSRVNEVEGLVRDMASARDADSVTSALNKADDYLSRRDHSDSSMSDGDTVVGFNRTVINQPHNEQTSVARGDSSTPGTRDSEQVAFCKALEEDARERAERREEKLRLGNRLKSEGNECFRKEQYSEALRHYSEALQQLPGDVILYTNRALTYMKLGQFDEVLSDCDTALKFNEKTLKAYLYKGKSLINLGRDNEARECFDTVLSMLPEKEATIKSYIKNIENWTSNDI